MAIVALDLDAYEWSSIGDEEEPKTVFMLKPLKQFEYMKIAGVYQKLMSKLNIEDDSDTGALLDFFASEDSDKFKLMFEEFLSNKIMEVRNMRDRKGELFSAKQGEFDTGIIPPMIGFEMFSDSISRIDISEAERKN